MAARKKGLLAKPEALEQLDRELAQEVNRWLMHPKHSPSALAKRVRKALDNSVDRIVLTVLGASDTWGHWEVDSKRQDSPIGRFIANQAKTVCDQWVKDTLEPKIATYEIPKELEASIDKEIDSRIVSMVRSRLGEMLAKQTERFLEEALKRLSGEWLLPIEETNTQDHAD